MTQDVEEMLHSMTQEDVEEMRECLHDFLGECIDEVGTDAVVAGALIAVAEKFQSEYGVDVGEKFARLAAHAYATSCLVARSSFRLSVSKPERGSA